MSIHDFYSKFVSSEEENTLLGTLRRLSLFEDPKAMFDEDPMGDWGPWAGSDVAAEGMAL
ncbi:MAG TPA: hypothetical protein VEW48_17445 [Thermoanaerobaculia bacterium]|nr:hypothetical protein [Thermoanaerobaculia bacterium]